MSSSLRLKKIGKAKRSRTVAAKTAGLMRTVQLHNRAIPVELIRSGGRMPANSGELKNLDVSSTTLITAAQTTGNLLLLNGVAQGTTAVTRLGRRITMKSIYIRINNALAATTAGASPLRYLVVYDKQANATAPGATDVVVADAIVNPNNLSNSRRFVTLMDWMPEQGLGTGGPVACSHVFYKKINLPVEFNAGSAGTVGDIQTGSVYVFVWQNGGLITAAPTQAFYSRIRYSDN